MPYTLYQFGDTVLPEYNTVPDVGTGRYHSVYREVPGGGVFRPAGRKRAKRRETPLSKVCTFQGDTAAAMRTTYNALRALGGTVDRLWRVWDSGDAEWCWAEMAEIPARRERGMNLHQQVELMFTMISPHWYGTHHGPGWKIDDPEEMVIGGGHVLGEADITTLVGSPQTIVVNNGGNREVTNAIFRITAGNAAITALTITCGTCEVSFTGTVAIGNILSLDFGAWAITNNAVDAYADFDTTANHTEDELMILWPGNNNVVVTYTGGGVGSEFVPIFNDGWE